MNNECVQRHGIYVLPFDILEAACGRPETTKVGSGEAKVGVDASG